MPKEARPIGVPPIVTSAPEIHRLAPQHFHQHAPTVNPRLDKIRFIKPSELPLCVYMMDEQFLRTPKVSKLIKELRGGSLTTSLIGNAVLLAVLYGVWILSGGAGGFVTPKQNPGWGLPNGSSEIQTLPTQPFCFPFVKTTSGIVTKLRYSLSLKNLINELV
jgi:hypothetical protein